MRVSYWGAAESSNRSFDCFPMPRKLVAGRGRGRPWDGGHQALNGGDGCCKTLDRRGRIPIDLRLGGTNSTVHQFNILVDFVSNFR